MYTKDDRAQRYIDRQLRALRRQVDSKSYLAMYQELTRLEGAIGMIEKAFGLDASDARRDVAALHIRAKAKIKHDNAWP